jgi:hypothetical protein
MPLTAKHRQETTPIQEAGPEAFPHARDPLRADRLPHNVDGPFELLWHVRGLDKLQLEFALDDLRGVGDRCTGPVSNAGSGRSDGM